MRFEKVSFEQFKKDFCKFYGMKDSDIRKYYDELELPTRSTKDSAGYDFHTPIPQELWIGKPITIPTGIRFIADDTDKKVFLMIVPRSGLGFKYQIMLANTVGIIDQSYYLSDNEGHILIKLVNRSSTEEPVFIEQNDRIAQGIIIPFLTTEDDNATGIRNGGFGSTGK